MIMRAWLLRSEDRRIFRGALDRVITRMRHRVSLEDIVTLCSAVESLSELGEASDLAGSDLDAMSEAAVEVARRRSLQVDSDRVRGVLSFLQHQSLPRRLKSMQKYVSQTIPLKESNAVLASIMKLRPIAAHGQSMSEVMPRVGPTVEAFASMCALFDLLSCGIPEDAHEHSRINPIKTFKMALQELTCS